jgi:hypothetical protein
MITAAATCCSRGGHRARSLTVKVTGIVTVTAGCVTVPASTDSDWHCMAFNLKFPLTVKPGPGRRARAPVPLQAGAAPYAFIFAEAQDFSQLNPCGETLCETLRLASLSAYHDSDDMLSDSLWLPVAAGGRSVAGRSHSSAMSALIADTLISHSSAMSTLIAEHTHQPLISHERTHR